MLEPYEPVVVFTGMINGTRDTLPGHRGFPNACYLDNDTVRITVCSKDYVPASTGQGSLMRLYIFPFPADSDSVISNKNALFHFVTHNNEGTCSYEIGRMEQKSATKQMHMVVDELQRRRGSPLELADMSVNCSSLGPHCGGGSLLIEGRITGKIAR
jgi:hypothetical protein